MQPDGVEANIEGAEDVGFVVIADHDDLGGRQGEVFEDELEEFGLRLLDTDPAVAVDAVKVGVEADTGEGMTDVGFAGVGGIGGEAEGVGRMEDGEGGEGVGHGFDLRPGGHRAWVLGEDTHKGVTPVEEQGTLGAKR